METQEDPVDVDRIVSEVIEEAVNRGRMEVLDEACAASCMCHMYGTGSVTGVEELKNKLAMLRIAFPDLQISIVDLNNEAEQPSVNWNASATRQGEYWGMEPDGQKIRMRGTTRLRVEQGVIQEIWFTDIQPA